MRQMKVFLPLLTLWVTAAIGSPLPDFPFVSVQGRAHTDVAPDIARVTIRVAVLHPDPAKATEMVRERSAELLKVLSDLNIPKTDIVAYEIEKDIRGMNKDDFSFDNFFDDLDVAEGEIKGYQISRKIEVTLHDLTKYEGLINPVLTMQHVELYGTDFDRTDRAKIEAELIGEACEHARQEAQNLATGFGVTLGPLKAAAKNGFRNLGEEFGLGTFNFSDAFCSMAGPEKTLFVPATITLEAYVSAVFQLEQQE